MCKECLHRHFYNTLIYLNVRRLHTRYLKLHPNESSDVINLCTMRNMLHKLLLRKFNIKSDIID